MSETKKGLFVIYSCDHPSQNPADWKPVKMEELPAWVIDPDNLGLMATGMMCMKCDEGDAGSLYYRAEVQLGAQDKARLEAALKARETREAKHLVMRPPELDSFIAIEQSTLKH